MNAIIGARGVGKTTLLLQRLRQIQHDGSKGLYITLDDPYFTETKIFPFAERFVQEGGAYLFLDEVHKYPTWGRELKNIFDFLPDLKVVFSGSSVLDIHRQGGDLSRRALYYFLPGLSFREYLSIRGIADFTPYALEDILEGHRTIANEIVRQVPPLAYFKDYLQRGYYPFFTDEGRDYALTLNQIVQLVLETDLRFIANLDVYQSRKMMQLLRIIAQSPPFKPNISKLSERIEVHRRTLLQYLHYLDQARLLRLATLPDKTISVLQKPDKVFLENPNLYHVLADAKANAGSMRETFFLNQLSATHSVALHAQADFFIDGKWVFEVGGRRKSKRQIADLAPAYIAADGLETGYGTTVPLWLFGFLY